MLAGIMCDDCDERISSPVSPVITIIIGISMFVQCRFQSFDY